MLSTRRNSFQPLPLSLSFGDSRRWRRISIARPQFSRTTPGTSSVYVKAYIASHSGGSAINNSSTVIRPVAGPTPREKALHRLLSDASLGSIRLVTPSGRVRVSNSMVRPIPLKKDTIPISARVILYACGMIASTSSGLNGSISHDTLIFPLLISISTEKRSRFRFRSSPKTGGIPCTSMLLISGRTRPENLTIAIYGII